MTCVYSFVFEFREESYKVNFYDDTTNIIAAESLAQISSQQRRKWARNLFDIFENDSNILQLEVKSDDSDTNAFSKRLMEENWTPFIAVYEIKHLQATLHIYRFYLFIIKQIIRRNFKFLR